MADNTDTINSMEIMIKGMATNMKSMEATIKRLESKVENLEGTKASVKNMEAKMDGLGEQLKVVTETANDAKIATKSLLDVTAHPITKPEEATAQGFLEICDELIRLTWSYFVRPTMTSYRNRIRVLSNGIAPSPGLRTFLCIATPPSTKIAELIVDEVCECVGADSTSYVTTSRVVALKRALLAKGTKPNLEYGSLISFLQSACKQLADQEMRRYPGDDQVALVVEHQIRRLQTLNLPGPSISIGEWNLDRDLLYGSKAAAMTVCDDNNCINGFRGLLPKHSPDPDRFKCVEREMAFVCNCQPCQESLRCVPQKRRLSGLSGEDHDEVEYEAPRKTRSARPSRR